MEVTLAATSEDFANFNIQVGSNVAGSFDDAGEAKTCARMGRIGR